MAPDSQCMRPSSDEHIASQVFVERVLAWPSVSQAYTFASALYHTTKEQQYVGVALQAAEVGMRVAANKALPLATPLVEHVGGWVALEKWACQGLTRVEEAAPIITKPAEEIVSRTRDLMLTTLAGDVSQTPPPTVTAALTTRASHTMKSVSESSGGRLALNVADRLLDTAHTILDTYLPPHEGDLQDSDGRDGSLVIKVVALADKTHRRLKRTLYAALQVHYERELNDEDIIITTGHLVEFGHRLLASWYQSVSRHHYVSPVVRGLGMVEAAVTKGKVVVQSSVTLGVGRAKNLVVSGVGRVQALAGFGVNELSVLTTSGIGKLNSVFTVESGGSVVTGGMHRIQDLMSNGMIVTHNATAYSLDLANRLVRKGTVLTNALTKNGLHVVHSIMIFGQDAMRNLRERAHIVLTVGLLRINTVLTYGMNTTYTVVKGRVGTVYTFLTNRIYFIGSAVMGKMWQANSALTNGVNRANSMSKSVAGLAHCVMMNSRTTGHKIVAGSMDTAKQVVSFLPPTITGITFTVYARISAAATQLNPENARKVTHVALRYTQEIPEWMVSNVRSCQAGDDTTDTEGYCWERRPPQELGAPRRSAASEVYDTASDNTENGFISSDE